METPKVKCEIVTERGRVERIHFREPIDAQLAKNYKAAGCIITPATAIPNERLDKVRAALAGIANAKRYDRDVFADDSAFVDWAMSLAKHTLAELGE